MDLCILIQSCFDKFGSGKNEIKMTIINIFKKLILKQHFFFVTKKVLLKGFRDNKETQKAK